jgi:hypothetical protein
MFSSRNNIFCKVRVQMERYPAISCMRMLFHIAADCHAKEFSLKLFAFDGSRTCFSE